MVLAMILSSVGCRICPDCEDMAYPAYGGAWERTIRDSGRVGSLFDPAGGRSSSLVNKNQPKQPDEIERMRQAEEREGSESDADRDDLSPFDDQDSSGDAFDDDAMGLENESTREAGENADANLDDELDRDLERRRKELQDMELRDIQVVPGEPLPPIL